MSAAAWPGFVLAIAAFCVAARRVYILAWRAPLDAGPLSSALAQRLKHQEQAAAIALCEPLAEAWPARCALALLSLPATSPEAEQLRATIDELQRGYRFEAQIGLFALHTLGRMALPLAFGCAIVVLSGAFGPEPDVERAQQALHAAVQCVVLGMLTLFFCRTSGALLQRQAASLLRDIRAVTNVFLRA
ncbi:MAG: hypothetical protein ABW321_30430 [Polyangiales bacterium]